MADPQSVFTDPRIPNVVYVCGTCGAHLDGLGVTHSCQLYRLRMGELLDRAEAERDRSREALETLRDELDNFARYSRSVAADAAGQARLTWRERAAWVQGLVATASDALDQKDHGSEDA